MHAEMFLKQFGHLANSDGGVKKLRQLVLQLAVQGEIVATSKQQWTVKPLGKVASFEYGKALPAKIRSDGGLIPVYGSNGITGYHDNPLITEQAIVIGRKGSAGALNIAIKPFWPTDVTYYSIPPQYLDLKFYYLLLSTLGLDKLGKGIKPGLNRNEAYKLVITYPPLAEQKRIVAKVDELMAVCDALEAAQNSQRTLKQQAVAATLHHLTTPATPADGGAALTILTRQFPEWFDNRTTLKTLRATILQLAVRGKLVPQDPTDEPASTLLKKIEKERALLLKSGLPNASEASAQINKQKKQILPSKLPTIPKGWLWATLMQCSHLVVDCHNKTAPYVGSGIPLLRTSNIRNGKLVWSDLRFVTETTYERWSARCEPIAKDILITREAPMGEVALIPEKIRVCMGQRMMLVRLIENTIDHKFLLYSLQDPNLMDRVQDKPVGMTVQHLRVGGIETLLIPLPPLAEQKRIVAKVDELMTLCDQLEAQLTTTQTLNTALMDALLHHLCAGAENTLHNKEAA
jgi:type I restriction enzyme S subunit